MRVSCHIHKYKLRFIRVFTVFYVKKNKFDEKKFINYFNKLKFLTNSNDVKKLKKLLKQSASF